MKKNKAPLKSAIYAGPHGNHPDLVNWKRKSEHENHLVIHVSSDRNGTLYNSVL
ncbi:hypothetical protein [Niabella hibiscisoli]|uniref:hypothetical protein n=1 Tax=Niabella hibiscisoli TaxID=1825928 RepID=UPI001F10AFA4|nr:hypothetical protein [Niabella hibiscisoli]MCH5717955.1 hypothetical protein [Niabella hibiscisoli]